jgi:hypothetical protein
MKILSHRGYWKTAEEKNTICAFQRSFSLGFGTETDIRDLAGELVVSHDMPQGKELSVRGLFEIYRNNDKPLPLALNIKSDGLQAPLMKLIREYQIENYFLFDMSIPDALVSLRHGLRCFTRQSEYEPEPAFYSQAEGVWLDGFHGEWWDEKLVEKHLNADKKVCIVSPDLHRRPHLSFWEKLANWDVVSSSSLMLCTDLSETAKELFVGCVR